MKHFPSDPRSVLALVAIMASPVALVVAFPVAYALGLDVFGMPSGRLVTLALWGAVGVVLLRRVLRGPAALGQPAS